MFLSFRLFFKQNETTASIMGYRIMITSFSGTEASHECQGHSKAVVLKQSVLQRSQTLFDANNKVLK